MTASTTVTMLSCFASALTTNDPSTLDYDKDYQTCLNYIADLGFPYSMGDEFFGKCEATGATGMVTDYLFFTGG